jgi:periplasmic protein CpxP/Spy
MRRLLAVLATVLAVSAVGIPVPAHAQQRPAARMQRDSLEARVRQRMGQVLKTQLGLTDEQLRRLQATNQRFEGQRRALFAQERDVRAGIRAEIASGDTTRNAQISALLDRMIQIQRERFDLLEAEQQELATFLTPVQRARYFGMEEQIRRRMTEMREQGARVPGRRPGDSTPPVMPRGRRP